MIVPPQKVVFLFGAGASAYSDLPEVCPPLGKDLYRQMRDGGLIPVNLPSDVARIFESNINFERGMEMLAASDQNELYIPFVRAMARYFSLFVPGPNNLYRKLFEQLWNTSATFQVASLNYDNLVDQCKQDAGFHKPVCRPHGSSGYLPDMRGNGLIDPVIRGVANNPVAALTGGWEVERATDPKRISNWLGRREYEWLSPAMSFYAPAKQSLVCPDFIEHEREVWRDMATWADACFVIGVACVSEDKHVWGPLATSACEINFMNPADAGFAAWCNAGGRKNAYHVPVKFDEAISRIFSRRAA
jgi:hypothetical protein